MSRAGDTRATCSRVFGMHIASPSICALSARASDGRVPRQAFWMPRRPMGVQNNPHQVRRTGPPKTTDRALGNARDLRTYNHGIPPHNFLKSART